MSNPLVTPPPPVLISAPRDDELEILEEIRRGRLERFDLLVNRYKTPLLRYLLHHVRQVDLAEDLAQETFLKLFRAPPTLRTASFGTWLFTLARNAAIDHLRAARSRSIDHERALRLVARNASIDPATAAILQEEHAKLLGRIGTLPPEQQEVLTLRVLADLSLEEISVVTGAPLPTVKSRLRYALTKCSHSLSQEAR